VSVPIVAVRRPTSILWLAPGAVPAAVFLAILSMTVAAVGDAAWGLLAAEQKVLGLSDSLTHLTVADPSDLGAVRHQLISWWAPGAQAVVYGLLSRGLSLGHAVKATTLAAWAIGMFGWGVYFAAALRERWLLPWLIGCMALFRMSHYSGFIFMGGETFFWAAVPLLMLANIWAIAARDRFRHAKAFIAGAVTMASVILKYSAGPLAVSVGAAWMWSWARGRVTAPRAAAWGAGALVGLLCAWGAGLGDTVMGPTPASELCSTPRAAVVMWAIGGPLMALSDAEAALSTGARLAGWPTPGREAIGYLALVLTVIFAAWAVRCWPTIRTTLAGDGSPLREAALFLGVSAAVVVSLSLAFMLLRGACISFEGRLQQYGAYMLLPVFAEALWASFRQAGRAGKGLSVVLVALTLIFPTAYGLTALLDKAAVRVPQTRTAVGSSGLRFDWAVGGAGAETVEQELLASPGVRSALFATTDPNVALMFPRQRAILLDATASPQAQYHRGGWTGAVVLFIPPDGRQRVDAIKVSFVDVADWMRIELRSLPQAEIWLGR
jgi:hypothetical protein